MSGLDDPAVRIPFALHLQSLDRSLQRRTSAYVAGPLVADSTKWRFASTAVVLPEIAAGLQRMGSWTSIRRPCSATAIPRLMLKKKLGQQGGEVLTKPEIRILCSIFA